MSKAKPTIIPAIGYLRKSTKESGHEKSIADQKARIGKMRPPQDGARYEIIRWYVDPGIPGWKPTHKRPDYFRMVNDLKERKDFAAILIDDMDRFSRRDSMETVADVQALRELGIRYIHAANQGVRDLAGDNMGMTTMQIAMEANASHEHCTRNSRRITETRAKKAAAGLRTGGPIPFGFAPDKFNDKGKPNGLKPGDPAQIKIVRWIFDQFANHARSVGWLCGDLNRRKVPSPGGGKWYTASMAAMLRLTAYKGDFQFNKQHIGQFHGIDAEGGVVRSNDLGDGAGKLFVVKGVHKPIVDPAVFDKVQQRFARMKTKKSKQRGASAYVLSGILVCDHCECPMHGLRPHRAVVYRCSGNGMHGNGTCKHHQIREDAILPFVLQTLCEEIKDLRTLLATPPDELANPSRYRDRDHAANQKKRDALAVRINQHVERILDIDDKETRKHLDQKIATMREELKQLDAELEIPTGDDYTSAEIKVISDWWNEFTSKAVIMPVPKSKELPIGFGINFFVDGVRDGDEETSQLRVDPRKTNEMLCEIGCEVRIRWESEEWTSKTGKRQTHTRHVPVKGRFRLGQKSGLLYREVLKSTARRCKENLSLVLSQVDRVFDHKVIGKCHYTKRAS